VKIRDLLSLVLDSILDSELFRGDSNDNDSREKILGDRNMKELTNLDILTK
jgi:hypothetical protein